MTPPIRIKHKSKPNEPRKEVVNVPISIIDNYKKDINTLKKFINDLEIKNKKYENKIHTSSLENSEKTNFINDLEKKYNQLEKRYNQLEDRYDHLEKIKIQLDESDNNHKNRISILLKEKQNNINKNKSLLNEIETFKETIKTLEDEILNKNNLGNTYKKEIERLTFILNKKKENENKMFIF